MSPNRVAVYLTAVAGIAGAVSVPVANLDTTSTVGVLGGLVTVLGAVVKWLDGWQKHEARQNSRVTAGTVFTSVAPPTPEQATTLGQYTAVEQRYRKSRAAADKARDNDDVDGDHEHPAATDLPVADPTKIPEDQGDAGGQS